MAYLKLSTSQNAFISVPRWFITDYMPKASSGHIKVYLYLLAILSTTECPSLEDVAKQLDMLYSEVLAALKAWDLEGVLSFKESSPTEENEGGIEVVFYHEVAERKTAPTLSINKTSIQQTRPNYSAAELTIYKRQEQSIAKLFGIAEEYLGRLLSSSDQQILFGLYDWLHLPIDLIEYLIEYCVSNHHTNLRYMEKVAIAWVDDGITTVETAKLKNSFDKRYNVILAELGLTSQTITKVQKDFINKWLDTYKLSQEIVLEACKRTMAQTKNPSLKYVDSILTSWHNTNVKSLKDIEELDKAFVASNTKPASIKATSPSKNQKFNSTYSHNWDFDQLAMLEQEYIERKLHGGE